MTIVIADSCIVGKVAPWRCKWHSYKAELPAFGKRKREQTMQKDGEQ